MYQKNSSNILDPKDTTAMRKYNEELKENLKLGKQLTYKYVRPLWISAKMKRFLKNDENIKNEAFVDRQREIEEN